MSAQRVWLINPFDCLPDSGFPMMRYESFAKGFIEAGWKVVWFTSDFEHSSRSYRVARNRNFSKPYPGLRIEFVHLPQYQATFGFARIWNHFLYGRKVRKRMLSLGKEKPDIIIVSLPLLGAVRAALSQKGRCLCKIVVDVQDLWPEALRNVLPIGIKHLFNLFCLSLIRYEKHIVKACDGIIAVSDTYLKRRGNGFIPKLKAYLGVDLASVDREIDAAGVDFLSRLPMENGKMTFLWVGSMRNGVDLRTVIKAAAILRDRGIPSQFVVAGDGPSRKFYERYAKKLGLNGDTIKFTGAYQLSCLPHLFFHSHVGLNVYPPNCANSTTNKLFEYQAGRLAIVNSIKGEVSELVTKNDMGLNYEAGNPHDLAEVITKLSANPLTVAAMGRAARKFVEKFGSRGQIVKQVIAFCTSL